MTGIDLVSDGIAADASLAHSVCMVSEVRLSSLSLARGVNLDGVGNHVSGVANQDFQLSVRGGHSSTEHFQLGERRQHENPALASLLRVDFSHNTFL